MATPLPAPAVRPTSRGFTLLEVMIALTMLLVGGVSILSVFTLAVTHRIERDIEARLNLVRPESRSMAQEQVDRAKEGEVPKPLTDVVTSQPGFTASATFQKSPNGDASWVASVVLSYQGKELRQGRLPPMWLSRSTTDPR